MALPALQIDGDCLSDRRNTEAEPFPSTQNAPPSQRRHRPKINASGSSEIDMRIACFRERLRWEQVQVFG
jgi:hypothetical protein